MSGWTSGVLEFFEPRAIDPEVAAEAPVREQGSDLIFTYTAADGSTFERRRSLNGTGPAKVLQPKGVKLTPWWPQGRPPETPPAVLVVEGETDALAALSALTKAPSAADLAEAAVAGLPGTGFPAGRLAEELVQIGSPQTLLALDADEPGRKFADRLERALREAGVPALRVELPEGSDVADVMAAADEPGEALATLLADA